MNTVSIVLVLVFSNSILITTSRPLDVCFVAFGAPPLSRYILVFPSYSDSILAIREPSEGKVILEPLQI